MNMQSFYRSPYAPRIHFDEAGAGGGAGAGAGDGGAGAGAGGGPKPWFDGIDAETIGHWDNKGWKKDDPKALASELTKAWKGLEKHFGVPADQILKLPKDATDEAGWSAVRQRLGMPKEAKEYDFSAVKFSDGTELDQGFTDTMRAALHKAGVSKDAAPEIARSVVKFMEGADAAEASERTARLQADRAALEREWGSNFEFNRLTAMQGAKRAVGSDEAAASMVDAMEKAIGYKATMEFWRKIGAGTTEDTFVDATKGGSPTTRNGAIARKAELEGDPAWVERYVKGDAKARQEMDSLLAQIHGVAA
jgi:hypothetical protein